MVSSSKRPKTYKFKQGESSSKSNPLNLTRVLANDAQRKATSPVLALIPKEEIERRKQQSLGETVKNRDILSAGYFMLEDRLVHYSVTYVILPKFSNHSQISDIELQLSPLPYAIFITKILEHFGISLDGETKVALNLRERKVDIEVVLKMGFVLDPVTRRTYKHRTDRQTAPTDQPEPTAPNQPESHAPSSSSVAMPSNQMILDELVSLRGMLSILRTNKSIMNFIVFHRG
ncbi:hypothetical protein Lal_00015601 [Lupinus albus]|nr:hypothetical protein Lal_00015601 [Lupinus albus]